MPHIALTSTANGSVGTSANAYWFRPDMAQPYNNNLAFHEIPVPYGVSATVQRPSEKQYSGRTYIVGMHSQNVLIDEQMRMSIMGIRPPTEIPTLATGAAGAPSGSMVGYFTYYDAITDERSSLSGPSAPVTCASQRRVWGNIPTRPPDDKVYMDGTTTANAATTITGTGTTFRSLRVGDKIALSSAPTVYAMIRSIADDASLTVDRAIGNGTTQTFILRVTPRATHVEFWVSVNGALPRLIGRRQIGCSALTDNVANGDLGEAFITSFRRMPNGQFNEIYHDRHAVAGVASARDVLYLSEFNQPEQYAGLSLRTRNGEDIVALVTVRDYLLVLCPRSSYIVQGYTEDDIQMQISEPQLGCINHHGIVVIHGRAFIPTHLGLYVFDGAWHFVTLGNEKTWRDAYGADARSWETGFGVDDKENNCYKLQVSSETGSSEYFSGYGFLRVCTRYWVAGYQNVLPQTGGGYGQPDWSIDVRGRHDAFATYLAVPGGKRGDLYTGDCSGNIRKDDPTEPTDDGDELYKPVRLRTMWWNHGDPGGGANHGKTLKIADIYLELPDYRPRIWFYGGDEDCERTWDQDALMLRPDTNADSGGDYTNEGCHHFRLGMVSGRGFVYEIVAGGIDPGYGTGVVGFRFRGIAGYWDVGLATRPLRQNPDHG